jgi:two-component system, cell cycle sensor histidine kinase and response regulator CckA
VTLGLLALIVSGLALGALLVHRLNRDAERLRQEQALLRAVIEGTSDAIFLKDASGRYRLANSAFARVMNRPVDEILGRDDDDLFPPETAKQYKDADQRVLATGQPCAVESETEAGGRRLIFLTSKAPSHDSTGRVQGVIGSARDITERKEVEEALRKTRDELEVGVRERTTALDSANAILKAVFDGTTDAVYVKDEAGRYLLANAAAARPLGRQPEEMLGRDDSELFTAGDARLIQELDRAIMAAGESRTIEQELQLGAETRHFLSTKGPYRDSSGRVIGLIGISRDVTDRRRSEEALRQSQKLESLGLLAGGVAHDFNNLLVAILGQTTLAHSRLAPDHPARENLEKAVKATERAADLTRQMLAYSGRGHFQVRPVRLNTVIEENLHLLRVAVSKRVRLASELAPDLPPVDADAGQLQQVVMNLITNAAEAIGDREGTVTVVTGARAVGPSDTQLWRHTGEPLPPGRYVSLEVRDDGDGMEAATLERVFDPFFTTKFTGRGLGLAAVLGIVRGHKGGLSVESEVGRGTVFRLLFPVSTKAPAPGRPAPGGPGLRGAVLVIDDEDVVREAIGDALASRNLPYLLARDGDEGLVLCRERGAEVGLVILDLSMPGRSGEETFRELRKVLPEVPVILSSGYGEDRAKAGFSGEDLAGFLQKPYRLSTLLAEVERCLKRDDR